MRKLPEIFAATLGTAPADVNPVCSRPWEQPRAVWLLAAANQSLGSGQEGQVVHHSCRAAARTS